MGLFSISRELQFEVCLCGEPSVSPQSARAGEHFYRGEEEVGMALSVMAFQWLSPHQERRAVFLPVRAAVITSSIKVIRGFLLGTRGLLERSVVVMTALCLEGLVLFRASPILSASQGGVLSRSSPHFPEANTERCYVAGSWSYNQKVAKSRF